MEKPEDRRKHTRFTDRVLAGARVTLLPVAPLFGEPASGYLIDLSAGGMALLMSDLIPRKLLLKMKMTLPDGYLIESVITVRHISRQKQHSDYLHGIEFLNPAPDMVERIELMAQAILACNERTQKSAPEICVESCPLTAICKRPQRIVKNVQPALIELTEALKEVPKPADPINTGGIQRPTLAEIEDFFRKAA